MLSLYYARFSNTPASPAQRGTVVQIFATGVGGAAEVTFSGVAAQILYCGAAPTFIGLDQINAIVPREATVGPDVPIVIAAGGRKSQENTFIAVE